MVTKGQDHSLAVYPKDEFSALARRAASASRSNPQARAFIRALAAGTDEQRLDTQGRIVLSAEHRRYANLTRDCTVIGSVDFLEIWDKQAWETYLAEHEEDYAQARDEALGGIF
jgi:MraZ protein